MADKKISQLTGATTPLAGTEVLPIVQSSATVKVSVADLTAGRSISTSGINNTGNISINAPVGGSKIGFIGGTYEGYLIPYDGSNGNTTLATTFPTASIFLSTNGSQRIEVTSDGNAVVKTAAKGVNFTANTPAAGMTSQLLNWYEEGTWTPALGGTWTSNPTGLTGNYVRIGRQVTIQLVFTGGAKATAVSGYFTGLPFATNYTASGTVTDSDIIDRGHCLAANTDRIWVTDTTFSSGTNICSVTYMT